VTGDPGEETLRKKWHSVYASDALSRRRKKTHLQKLKKTGFLDLPKTAKILDVACGEGEMLDLMAETGFSDLAGLDPFEPSRRRTLAWKFVQGSGGKLPFQVNDFDVILCAHALHHFSGVEEIKQFLNEAERVLRPGGRLYIIDHYDSWQLGMAHFLLMSPLAKWGSWTSAFHDQLCAERKELDSYVKHYPEVRRAILAASFSVKQWRQDLFFFYFEGRKRS
jgi:ubiquinone/menaquinone biosynthesis C-methylase UbiE